MPIEKKPLILTIGGFDGVHLGHQEIIRQVKDIAREINGTTGLVTFHPHPAQLLYPDFPYLLTPLQEKLLLFTELGIDYVHILRFDQELRSTEPEKFVRETLIEMLQPAAVVIGIDHRFGRDARGDVKLLKSLCQPRGIRVETVPEFIHLGTPVKSTRIREHLILGHIRLAAELLGRPYSLSGYVVRGRGAGKQLGFPTINIQPFSREKLLPAEGVYAATAEIDSQPYAGVANIGFRPTFSGDKRTVEIHLINFTAEVKPGEMIVLRFHERIRPERRFATADALAEQIRQDILTAVNLLKLPRL
ncbi:MAG: bifunctional riboflavin kinase/FAD synthetase [bacterium]